MRVKVFISLLLCFLLVANSFAMDIGCVVGGCENQGNDDELKKNKLDEMYDCVCPPRDTVGTILDVLGVLTLPLQFFSNKPRFDVPATSMESLIKKGCRCKLRTKKDSDNYSSINQDVNQEQFKVNETNNFEK